MMVTFIEADAMKYAELAREDRLHVMVHREDDGSLTCELGGEMVHADNGWQLSSRAEARGFVGISFWLDSVFSEPGVMLPENERVWGE